MLSLTHQKLVETLVGLTRGSKTLVVIICDYVLLVISFWLSLSLRGNSFYEPSLESLYLILFAPIISIPIYYFFGLYQSLIRYTNNRGLGVIIIAASIYTLLWFIIVVAVDIVDRPYDFLAINWLLTVFLTSATRLIARSFLSVKSRKNTNVMIYGAGDAAIQLESAIKFDPDLKVVAFVDDDKSLEGKYIEDVRIYSTSDISKIIKKLNVEEILLAIPSVSKNKQYLILNELKKFPVTVRKLPGLSDLARGRVNVSDLRKIKTVDLLKRNVRKPNQKLLEKDINDKSILVTGAGGSIGSELCREIVKLSPERVILFEINEFALYELENELREKNFNNIHAVLGDINFKSQIETIMKNYNVETVFHAAAYKHVPMVEKNSISAVRTNIFGTMNVLEAAFNFGVKNFVFISTDKAVRPTNIMGASKRFAELLIQAMIFKEREQNIDNQIRVSMVRFGNVLGSSGSVVPLFEKQIQDGGPLTVTDPNIIRYFMTINEAAQLVIQSGAMGKNGEIFLLDMGQPVKVLELAKDMVQLSGMTVRDEKNINGDIEIHFVGLRPGEKLFEELLIDHKAKKTDHKKIMLADEKSLNWKEIRTYVDSIDLAIKEQDHSSIAKIFEEVVEGFEPNL